MQRKVLVPSNEKAVILTPAGPVVILQDEETGSSFPIWIGPAEGGFIVIAAMGIEVPRPLTPDTWKNSLVLMGAMVEKSVITKLENDTYYAEIHLDIKGRKEVLDSRPSDAIALAQRFDAPVFIEEELFMKILDNPDTKTVMELIERDIGPIGG